MNKTIGELQYYNYVYKSQYKSKNCGAEGCHLILIPPK